MKAQRVFRANCKPGAERARERALRERLQREKPSLDDLIRSGECGADSVMTMETYFEIQQALQAIKKHRKPGAEVSEFSLGDG